MRNLLDIEDVGQGGSGCLDGGKAVDLAVQIRNEIDVSVADFDHLSAGNAPNSADHRRCRWALAVAGSPRSRMPMRAIRKASDASLSDPVRWPDACARSSGSRS